MKRKYTYRAGNKVVEREYNYIPVRYIISIILILLEVAAVVVAVALLCRYIPYFYLAAWATEIVCVIRICSSDDNPEYKVPWLLVVLVLPIAGFMLYFLFYKRTLDKKLLKRLKKIRTDGYAYDDNNALADIEKYDTYAAKTVKMIKKSADVPVFYGGKQEYFPSGESKMERLLSDLESAECFIFMEYFIVEEGLFWNSILDILKRKAEQGVEVRFMYDDFGCMTTLPGNYYRSLSSYGIKAVPFAKLKPSADGEFNNRNHRKITVIDGKIGYTGGINIADEYINRTVRFGHWKDTAVRLEGRAVWELTRMFLSDYAMYAGTSTDISGDYYPDTNLEGEGFVIPFGDGPRPLYERGVAKELIMNMISSATRYVYITTPYLIIDNDMCTCLETAALGGIDVRIVVPHIPDKRIVFEITRSFYPRLMRAGVKMYEYTPGFIHAKTYVADGRAAMVGTVNMDYRSLVHHFECGVLMYGTDCISNIVSDVEATMDKSIPVTEDMTRIGFLRAALRSAVRVFATLL